MYFSIVLLYNFFTFVALYAKSVTMKITTRCTIWCLLLCFFVANIFFSCSRPSSTEVVENREVQLRFDSAYHFVVNNMLMSHEYMDTLLALCDEMASVSPAQLEQRQIKLWVYSYALAASVYINHNELKRGLASLQRAVELADSIGDRACLNRSVSMLALIYSSWKLNDKANELFDQVIATSDKKDVLSTANAYLSKAIHLVYTAKYDSALYYLASIDSLKIVPEDMLPGSYKSVDYSMRFYRGWCMTEIPDSLQRGISLLQGLYDEYYPQKEEAVAFEAVCCRLGRAYELADNRLKADMYYREAKDMILSRPISFQLFETADPLMNAFIRENDTDNMLELLPAWKKIVEQYYDNQLNGMLAFYSVKLDVAGMEKQMLQVEGKLVQRRMEIIILMLVIVLLLMLVVWGILYWRYKKRQLRTLFETLMRRYIGWREMEMYLVDNLEKRSLLPDVPLQENDTDANDTGGETVMDEESVSVEDTKGDEFYRNLYYRVLLVMERDRLFLNPELSISLLAKAAITNRTHLSTAINRMTGNNFSTWLAEYRVNYAIHLMTNSDSVNLDTLYKQAGFGSRTTFFRQFKQLTGLTPKQFLKQRMS